MVALENNQRLPEKVGLAETIGPFGLNTVGVLATETYLRILRVYLRVQFRCGFLGRNSVPQVDD